MKEIKVFMKEINSKRKVIAKNIIIIQIKQKNVRNQNRILLQKEKVKKLKIKLFIYNITCK